MSFGANFRKNLRVGSFWGFGIGLKDFSLSPVAFCSSNIPNMLSTEDILSLTFNLPGMWFHQLSLLISLSFQSPL